MAKKNDDVLTGALALPEIKTEGLSNLPSAIHFNFDEVKAYLNASLENTRGLVVTEENYKQLKTVRANISKVEKALKGAGTEVKAKLLAPFAPFDEKVKELVKICEESHAPLDKQIKEIEAALKTKKANELQQFIKDEVTRVFGGEDPMFGKSIYWNSLIDSNESWLNASTSMKSAKGDITRIVETCKQNLDTLRATVASDSDKIRATAEMRFAESFDFADVMRRVNAYKEEQKKIEERAAKMEAERKAREEAEAARKAAEEARIAAQREAEAAAIAEKERAQAEAKAKLAALRAGGTAAVTPPPAAEPAPSAEAPAAAPQPQLYSLTLSFHATLAQMKGLRAYIDANGITYTKVGDVVEYNPNKKG